MDNQQYEMLHDDSHFFHSFNRTSFFERLARWSRFLCYGFLLFNLGSIILHMVHPFAVNPPDLFLQLLFLLLLWGCIELIAIPLEAIKDTCTLDYQKNWVTRGQHRFFFTRVVVLASFNQIKSIGVSCRPGPLTTILFAKTDRRYAIQILDLNNQLFSLTDYNLNLEEANQAAQNLYNRHLNGAQLVPGMPDFEIVLDTMNSCLTSRPCSRSLLSAVDAVCIPALQALIAMTGTTILLGAIIVLLGTSAVSVFNTNLQIARQPAFQLLHSLNSSQESQTILTPPDGPPPPTPALPTTEPFQNLVSLSATEPQSITLNLFAQQVVASQASNAAGEVPTASAGAIQDPLYRTEVSVKPPVSVESVQPETPTTTASTTAEVTASSTTPVSISAPSEDINKAEIPAQAHEKIEAQPAPAIESLPQPDFPAPVLEPLISRIPAVDPASLKPVSHSNKPAIASETSAPPATPQPLQIASKIEPGHGLNQLLKIGNSIEPVLQGFGPPLATSRKATCRQYIYAGLTINSSSKYPDKIGSMIITRAKTDLLGQLETAEYLAVGGKIDDVVKFMGPPNIIYGRPGLHFPGKGISFLPSAVNPAIVGAIEIYTPGGNPDAN